VKGEPGSGVSGSRIVLLPVPRSLREAGGEKFREQGSFAIDPAIPIPVEIQADRESLSPDELTMEMILAGMLTLIAMAADRRASGAAGAGLEPGAESEGGAASGTGAGLGAAGADSAGPAGSMPEIRSEWVEYYRRFVAAVRPDIFVELNEAAVLKAKNGDFDASLEIFAALTALVPGSPVALLNRALTLEEKASALERSGDLAGAEQAEKAAEEAYERVLALDPPFPNALFNAAYFRLKRRDFAGAEECFAAYTALGDQGGLPDTESEKRENAGIVLREIRERFLTDEDFREAWDLVRGGREKDGLEKIRGFIERHPEVWNGWFILGWALRRLERWQDGAAALQKALELGGSNADVRNEFAICLMELADLEGARRELEAALREEPENPRIINNLGVLSLKRGNRAEAEAFFRAALEPGSGARTPYL
jgi:Flp pilus assembly protein TadD